MQKKNKKYLNNIKAIGFFREKATPQFWDVHWKKDGLREYVLSIKTDAVFIPKVRKYLQSGSKILEGGCGQGLLVNALKHNGYNAIGIDYAKETVRNLNEHVPELDIRYGDVRELPFRDKTFDGYISAGVIEHFWEGYDKILFEMNRVIKQNGYLFLTFPYMSPIRKLKATLGIYSSLNNEETKIIINKFYQFALNHKTVTCDLKKYGFKLVKKIPFDGIKGFKDEIKFFNKFFQNLYDGKYGKVIKYRLDQFLKHLFSHAILLILKKVD